MKRALICSILVVAAFIGVWDQLPYVPVQPAIATELPDPSGALSPQPLNSDFTAGEPIVVAPTNYGFEDGLNNWNVVNGSASTASGGQSGDYLSLNGNGSLNPKVESSAFTVDSSAPIFSYYRKHTGSFTMHRLELATGPNYNSWSQVAGGFEFSSTGWIRTNVDLSSYAGTSVKIRYSAYSTVGFDEGATRMIPSWSRQSGLPYWEPALSISATTASTGDFTSSGVACTGSVVPARTAPVATIEGNGSIQSNPFTIPGDAGFMTFYVRGQGTGASATISLYLESESYNTQHALFNKTIGTSNFYTTCTLNSSYKGENVKLRVSGSSGGTISVVSAGDTTAGQSDIGALPTDPVSPITGVMMHKHTDLEIPGKGIPLEFTRYYIASRQPTTGTLGFAWTYNYEANARVSSNGDVLLQYPDASFVYFKKNGSSYDRPMGVYDTLVKNGDNTYTLTLKSQVDINFDTAGKLTSFVDRNGNTTTVTYSSGYIDYVTAPGGRVLDFTVTSGRVTAVEDDLGRTVEYAYDGNGDLSTVTDVKDGDTTYTYADHKLLTITDALDQLQLSNTYDEVGRVAEREDAVGGITCFYYGNGPGYTSANCDGVSPAPSAGEMVKVDARGNKETHSYDTFFREVAVQDALDNVTLFTYEASGALCSPANNGNRCSIMDPLDHETSFTFDSSGNMLTKTNAEDETTTYTYTGLNDVDLETDPLGNKTDYIYDSPGNVTRAVRKDAGNAVKALVCYEPDDSGQPTAVVLSTDLTVPGSATAQCTGNRTLLGYDDDGLPVCQVNARFSNTTDDCDEIATKATMVYDAGGRVTSVTNELRQPVSTAESGASCGSAGTGDGDDDDSDTVVDDGCPNAIYTYDNLNNTQTMTDANGNVSTSVFNVKGINTSGKDANRATVGTAESGAACGTAGTGDGDDDDSDTAIDDGCPNGIGSYDPAGRVTSAFDALGNKSSFAYDENGNVTSVTNAARQPVSAAESGAACGTGTGDGDDDDSDSAIDDGCPSAIYTYNEVNQLASEIDALDNERSYTYWEDGTLKQRTDARGLVTKYFYDDAKRLETVEHWDGESMVDDVAYVFDDAGNRTSMADGTGTTTYSYDTLNRMTSTTAPGSVTVGYTYDDLPSGSAADYPGQRTKITYADSKTATYTFEPDGRMSSVTDWLSNTTSYEYDDAGRLETTSLPNGVTSTHTYDVAGRLDEIVNEDGTPAVLSSYEYTMDKVGNRTEVVDTNGTTTIGYDALYQVTDVTYPNDDEQAFTYDEMGNRLTMDLNETTTEYEYDAADELVQADAVSYNYDENGNQVERGSDTFDWDHENRLVATDVDSTESSYTYNGDGLRVSRTIGEGTVDYVWDVGSSVPVVLQDSEDNTYVYGLDLISRTDGGGDQEYYLTDGLGSTTGLTDDTGDLVDEYQYDVFGAVRDHTGDSPNEFTFTGEQNDPTGLEYLRARYYDPATGRFLGRDPIPYLQRYAYARSNPTNLTDPTGLSPAGNIVTAAMEATAACLASVAGKMLDISAGNPCAAELAAMNAAVEAMLEATWADISEDLGDLKEVITSDCAIGVGQLVGGAIVIGGATVAGGEFIAAGGLVASTAGTTLISGTAVGYVALGPDPAWTLVRITNFTLGAQQNLGACFS